MIHLPNHQCASLDYLPNSPTSTNISELYTYNLMHLTSFRIHYRLDTGLCLLNSPISVTSVTSALPVASQCLHI